MGLVLTVIAIILAIVGLVWILNGSLVPGIVLIVVACLIGGGYHGYYGRRPLP